MAHWHQRSGAQPHREQETGGSQAAEQAHGKEVPRGGGAREGEKKMKKRTNKGRVGGEKGEKGTKKDSLMDGNVCVLGVGVVRGGGGG